MVHVVLSDMCAPWDQTSGFWKRSLSDPYNRMMNTTGIKFSDHAGSMVCYFSFCFPFYFSSSHLLIFVFQSLAVCSQLDSTQIKSITYAILTTIYVRACRISATRLCDLPSKRWNLGVILCVSFIRAPRIKSWSWSWGKCLPWCIERSRNHRGAWVSLGN